MNRNRISMLEKFMLEEPADPFPVYALALEYQVTEKNKAQELFERLLRDHPDYLPTYYLAGIFFLEQNEINRATEIFHLGLTLAKQKKNLNTMREIQAVLDSLEE
ncbi:MAG TPA: tetratricopeptide repeat protein [Cyclobacteriaceae bacterium]|jgi:tetratricopeptide (TPR) repeat protein|nr:tetratricopeptide repeat protein [Cytophagales bacterium]HNT51418.1 tetratricopeptide repeat protein [Cyclobacteriaceae bacterium]HRF32735.1 tetratricopeptide repeat protein [Cyclobacteriaceae bacterium]